MKRPFPRFEVLGLTAALALAAACTPDNAVKPGAPVLTSLSIVENPGGFPYTDTVTTVTATTGFCPAATKEGDACDPVAYPSCEAVPSNILCRCVAAPAHAAPPHPAPAASSDAGTADAGAPDGSSAKSDAGPPSDAGADGAAPTPAGTWSCSFAPTAVVLYTFDRLLDTAPFNNDAGNQSNAAMPPTFDPTPPSPVSLIGDYSPNGSPNLFIFNFYSLRAAGPSLFFAATPTLPTGTTVGLTLNKTTVLAKDGRTSFTATTLLPDGATSSNLLIDGAITFVTQSLSVSVVTPPPPNTDAAAPLVVPDMTAATATFNNIVCPQKSDGTFDATGISKHITVTAVPAIPATVTFDIACVDGFNVTITPSPTWPASSSISISVDATAADVLGDTLGAAGAVTASFDTGAM
jgi:hypothetical protein